MLCTLGSLHLAGFRRVKPLLLAFVALEGHTPRRRMAQLLWPSAAQPETSLRTALYFLRDQGPLFDTDDPLQTHVPCDAVKLLEERGLNALHAYSGAFLDNVDLSDVSSEFEEWVREQRERLAGHVQVETLNAAERLDPAQAASLAEQAFRLPGAPPAEMGLLRRMLALSLPGSAFEAELRADLSSFAEQDQPQAPENKRGRMLGRHIELDTLLGWALQDGGGIASVSGPGGIGKSTLGRELLRELSMLGRQVLHVDAEGVRHTSELMARMVTASGSKRQAPDTWAGVARLLGEPTVVLLDGTDALENLPELLLEATRALPQVRWVLTGRRARLGVPAWRSGGAPRRGVIPQPDLGEVLSLRLSGLEVPAPDTDWAEFADSSAVQLLLREGGRFRRDLKLNAETAPLLGSLARRLQGHPLALALAASWLRVEDLPQVYARVLAQAATLEDADPALNSSGAKRGLAVVAARSWELLGESEQAALLRLSVCPDFDPQDAPALGVPEHELDALLEHSFLETFLPGSERQRICPALSSVAQTYGPQHPELLADAQKRHAEHYLGWFCQLQPRFPKIAEDRQNVCLAIQTALVGGWLTPEPVYHLMRHFDGLAIASTGTDTFQELCAAAEACQASDDVKAATQIACMWLAQRAGRLSYAQSMAERFLASSLAENQEYRMRVLNTLAILYKHQGKYEEALCASKESVHIAYLLGNSKKHLMHSMNLLEYFIKLGQYQEALLMMSEFRKPENTSEAQIVQLSFAFAELEMPDPNCSKVIADCRNLLAQSEAYDSVFSNIGIYYCIAKAGLLLGDGPECSQAVKSALDLIPDPPASQWFSRLLYVQGQEFYRSGKRREAKESIKSGLVVAHQRESLDDLIEGLICAAWYLEDEKPHEVLKILSSLIHEPRVTNSQRNRLSGMSAKYKFGGLASLNEAIHLAIEIL